MGVFSKNQGEKLIHNIMVEIEKISATYKNGELSLVIPKVELVEQKPKLIEVK